MYKYVKKCPPEGTSNTPNKPLCLGCAPESVKIIPPLVRSAANFAREKD